MEVVNTELQKVARLFLQSLPNRILTIETSVDNLSLRSLSVQDACEQLCKLKDACHSLYGTSGSLGFQEIADKAKGLHQFASQLESREGKNIHTSSDALVGLYQELRKAADSAKSPLV